ncbi:MAG: CehA/McbA family metallohydrolase, partial [Lachnospiraceae bacterium]|nr:CehA/McbA family metallohydrolase [Lachnospiraceae bacterium]
MKSDRTKKSSLSGWMPRLLAWVLTIGLVLGNISIPVKASGEAATIAGWSFTAAIGQTLTKEDPVAATEGSGKLWLDGAKVGAFSATNGLASTGWNNGGSWVMSEINAENYEALTFSAKTRSSGTGPKDFQLEYSLDSGETWEAIEGSQYEVKSTGIAAAYSDFALPAELSGQRFALRIHMISMVSQKGETVQSGGASNINNIVIAGTKTSESVTPPENETCAKVTASVAEGEVEKGTEVALSCATEGASVSYKLNDAADYEVYSAPIVISEDTVIEAYAKKEGFTDSEKIRFAYTVKEETPETPETPEQSVGAQLKALEDGDVFFIYHPESKMAMTSQASGSRLAGASAEAGADGAVPAPAGTAVLKAELDQTSGYFYLVCAGKYLTSGATGNSLTLETEKSEYSLWDIEKADDNGGFFLRSANAAFNGVQNQYIEYYNTFTTYGKKEDTSPNAFLMYFYPAEESKDLVVEDSIKLPVAQWAGNANYEEANVDKVIAGDLYKTNDMLDKDAGFRVVVSGAEVKPYSKATASGTGSVSYYMGGTGLGSGTDDYMQMQFSSHGYGKMGISFRLRASNTGAGSFQAQYSADGKQFRNLTTGSYSYKYTSYGSDGKPFEVSKADAIKDGIAKTSLAPANYINFQFDLPDGAANAENLYIRFVPGTENAKGDGNAPGTGGVVRIDSVNVTGSPVIASDLCGYVKADPADGEATQNSEVTLTTTTEGSEIFYSLNGGEYQKYDPAAKPVLTELPATLRTYAKKDGMADSIKVIYQYTAGKVKSVKATPNGGAVKIGTEVTLSCDTEGAVIYYSENEGADWIEYTEKLVLSELPKTYLVKASKEGYEDSSVQTLSFTERTSDVYGIYFGQLHSHTNYSDGAGTCEEAFQHASGVDNLDFLAVTDHSNSFDNADAASITDGSMSSEWTEGHALAEKYTAEDFVALYGYEMTWSNGLGHMNTFNSEGFQSRTQTDFSTYSTALQNYYAALKKSPNSISQFNHPGTTFGDFSDFGYYDEDLDKLITTVEVGNGEGAVGSSGYFPSYEYYQRALDKGWHVAPTNNQDNHKGLWGDANTGRSVVLADSLTRENVYDAMRNYRVYATEDNDLNIYYTLDGYEMGSILSAGQTGETVSLKADIKDATDSEIGKVQVITNGGLVLDEAQVNAKEEIVEFTVDNKYSYYYLKITETDGDIAVTAPVWVGEVEAAGINSISTTEVLPVKGEALPVDLNLYNNEDTAMQIEAIDFKVDGSTVHSVDLEKAGLTSIAALKDASYSFDFTYDKVGSMELNVEVKAKLNGADKLYKSVLKLNYVTPEMVTNVVIDGTHYNDYVTGYYGGNVGNFTKIAGDKNVKVTVVKDKITPEILEKCALLLISAPAKKKGTANAGDYTPAHFSDEFIQTVKAYTDNGGTLIACGIADYQDSTETQTATEMNKLLNAVGATTTLNSDEAYDEVNNGGQPYRLYLKNYNSDSKYLAGAAEGQEYSAYSGCTVNLNADAVNAGKAEALVTGYDTTYSIDCKDEAGNKVSGQPAYIEKGSMVAIAHEKLAGGGNLFVSGTVFISDFEVKAEQDNIWDLPYLNKTIAENILKEVTVELEATPIAEVRKANLGEVFAIEGYVTAGTSNPNNTFFDAIYVQDDTAGITVFPYSASGLEVGTKVKITGYVDAYQGDKEIQIMSCRVIEDAEKHVYDPKEISAKEAMDYTANGGNLVKVTGKVSRVVTDTAGTGVSQFWIDDGSGVEANIFIDGYILSGTEGTNTLASTVKEGASVSAVGLVYAHPEGESDVPVTCLRVRDCDEIKLISEGTGEGDKPGSNGKPG